MSLEAQISTLNDSIQALILALSGAKPQAAKPTEPAAAPEKTPATPATVAPQADAAASATPEPAAGAMVYADIGVPITQYVQKYGRDDALAILAPFKLTRATDAKPEQWPAILAAFNKAIAAKAAA